MNKADVLSLDLGWNAAADGRAAVALRSGAGVRVQQLDGGDDEVVEQVGRVAEHGALVLLDVPIDGCGNLSSTRPRRCVDDGLAKSGIPVLPSVKAGKRGPELRTLLLKERADLLIEESYPYAVLRVLWALRQTSRRFRFKDDGVSLDLSTWWWRWPPKYKRARRVAQRRMAMSEVAEAVAAIGGFGRAVPTVEDLAGTRLRRAADELDALLGLVAGIASRNGSTWCWRAHCGHERDAAILTIADASLRRRFDSVLRA
jgi:predicted nuclease with RNAse H fold